LSDNSYYIAATVPNAPPAPVYVSSTGSTATLQFLEPSILGGSPLTGFKLYVDALNEAANYELLYSGVANQFEVNSDNAPTLAQGVTYRYVLVASNVFGDSTFSEEIRVAFGSLPLAPNTPVKVEEFSTPTAIAV
jgi:hypothetical protein